MQIELNADASLYSTCKQTWQMKPLSQTAFKIQNAPPTSKDALSLKPSEPQPDVSVMPSCRKLKINKQHEGRHACRNKENNLLLL